MTKLFQKLKLTLSITCVTFILVACGKSTNTELDHLVFRYNEHSNIPTLDPAFARAPQSIWPDNQLFNGLVQLDDSLNILPDIAKSWTVNDSSLTYTFILRNDVFFHKNKVFVGLETSNSIDSTRTVNATDFAYSFDRLVDEKLASSGSWVLQNVLSYQAINDTVFTIQR